MRRLLAFVITLVFVASGASATTPKKTPTPNKHTAKSTKASKAKRARPKARPGKTSTTKSKPAQTAAHPLKKALLGKWQQIDGADRIEFRNDGMFSAANPQIELTGKYRVRDDGKLEIELGLGKLTKGPLVRKVDLKSDHLTLTDEVSGLVMKYQRPK
jgi:hypothetical protein